MASAQGKDFSSYQRPVTQPDLAGLAFAGTRISNWAGTRMGTDPNLAHNLAAFRAARLLRIAYWYLLPGVDPVSQANFAVHHAKAAGLAEGDVFACDSEEATANANAATRAFCAEAGALLGPAIPVVIYTDQFVGRTLTSCTHWPLWLAWPSAVAPGPAQCAPWPAWTFWQWGQRSVDQDAFNGDEAALAKWIAQYVKPSPPPAPPPVSQPLEADVLILPVLTPAGPALLLPVPAGKTKLFLHADPGYRNQTPPQMRVACTPNYRQVTLSPSFGKPATFALAPGTAEVTIAREDTGTVPVTISWG